MRSQQIVTASPEGRPAMHRPALSLVLCSRNDRYQGDSVWRLQTALDYAGRRVAELGREEDVEIVVSDWGSEFPLRDRLELTPQAARIVRFLTIPPDVARAEQKDSPFPEVLALNAAVRRASGEYVGRIDQDTLVGRRFFEIFFWLREKQRLLVPLESTVMISNRRGIPYRFAVRRPSLWAVERYLDWRGNSLSLHDRPPQPEACYFYLVFIGVYLMHRDIWEHCRGFDESFIYMDHMETDLTLRLSTGYHVIDLGAIVDHSFYHLDHEHPWVSRSRSRDHRNANPLRSLDEMPPEVVPNSATWGLARYPFELLPLAAGAQPVAESALARAMRRPAFLGLWLASSAQTLFDPFILAVATQLWRSYHRCRRLLGWLGARYVRRQLGRLGSSR
jgi:hypothetical protein